MSKSGTQTAPPSGQTSSLYTLSSPARAAEWNYIVRAGRGGLLQSWRWGLFKSASGWTPRRYALHRANPAGDTAFVSPAIAAQVLFRTMPRLPLPVSIAYVPRGPLIAPHASGDDRVERAFWQRIHAQARKMGAIFLKVEPDVALDVETTREAIDRKMLSMGFQPSGRLQPARTIVLDLGKSEDDLLKAMKPKTRYNLRLAERRGVVVRRAATIEDLRSFYSLLEVTGDRDEFGIHTFPYYRQLWSIFGPDGDNSALVLLAEHPDDSQRAEGPVAGLLALRFGREAIYMYGASANRARAHMPNYLLQWHAIKWAKEHNCEVYDFWGIPDQPSEETGDAEVSPINTRSGLRGVYWFKKGFGGREIDYPGAYDYVYNPLLYRLWMRWRGANLG